MINGGVNQRTLADRLGLSRATVSRCFTNHRAINPATRAKVFDLAAELGYRYMELRTPVMRKPKGRCIGVLICYAGTFGKKDRFENPGQKLLDGVSELAQLQDVRLDVNYVPPEATLESPSYHKITALRRGRWNGALLIYPFPGNVVDALLQRVPCVSLVEQNGRNDLNCVDVDHYRGVSKAVNLLVKLGHRRIGFFATHPALEMHWVMHRFAAYFQKLLTARLKYQPDDVINVLSRAGLTEEEAQRQLALRTADGVTAWVCASDYAAYSAIGHLTANGVRVPDDVSITGFDGIKPPAGAPAATTLQIPFREIGRTGIRRLLDLIKAPFDPPQHILLSCQLRRGETVAAPGRLKSDVRSRMSEVRGQT